MIFIPKQQLIDIGQPRCAAIALSPATPADHFFDLICWPRGPARRHPQPIFALGHAPGDIQIPRVAVLLADGLFGDGGQQFVGVARRAVRSFFTSRFCRLRSKLSIARARVGLPPADE